MPTELPRPDPTGAANYAELLVDGHRVLPSLLADIARAERVIHVSVFLFFHDPVGDAVADALVAAKARGVVVRVLLNVEKTAMGDPFSTGEREMMRHDPNMHHDPCNVKPLCERMRSAGIEVFDTNIEYAKDPSTSDPRLRSIAKQIRGTIDIDALHIDHRKIVVIDGAVAYCGGANIGAQYLYLEAFDPNKEAHAEGEELKAAGNLEPWWKWHDSWTRFEGPIARELDGHFRVRWILDGGDEYEPVSGPVASLAMQSRGVPIRAARTYANAPDDQPNEVRELYLDLIARAERSIFIENPYFYHPALVDALVQARERRGDALRIDLVLPARTWNDSEFSFDAQQYHYERYVTAGIVVHEYQNHFNHLKIAAFDERWSIHGSTNLNFRSLENDNDFELVVLVDDEALARRVLAEVRDVDIPRSKLFTKADVEGDSVAALRIRTRDPRTLLLVSRKVL
jgi:cardiolipin synthase